MSKSFSSLSRIFLNRYLLDSAFLQVLLATNKPGDCPKRTRPTAATSEEFSKLLYQGRNACTNQAAENCHQPERIDNPARHCLA
jgi:hypothetical protein